MDECSFTKQHSLITCPSLLGMTTSPSYFVALAFINLQSSLPFILMPFLFTHHESIKAGGALQFKVFSLIIDRLSPNH